MNDLVKVTHKLVPVMDDGRMLLQLRAIVSVTASDDKKTDAQNIQTALNICAELAASAEL